jgi:hypothetical protein
LRIGFSGWGLNLYLKKNLPKGGWFRFLILIELNYFKRVKLPKSICTCI